MQYGLESFLPTGPAAIVSGPAFVSSGRMTLAERLAKLMHESDRSQVWLERQTGISQSAISRVLRGDQRLYFDQAAEIAKALDVSLDELAGLPPRAHEKAPELSAINAIVKSLGHEEALKRLLREPGPAFGPPVKEDGGDAEGGYRRTGTR